MKTYKKVLIGVGSVVATIGGIVLMKKHNDRILDEKMDYFEKLGLGDLIDKVENRLEELENEAGNAGYDVSFIEEGYKVMKAFVELEDGLLLEDAKSIMDLEFNILSMLLDAGSVEAAFVQLQIAEIAINQYEVNNKIDNISTLLSEIGATLSLMIIK